MRQIVGELIVEKNADPEPLRSSILYLQLPGQRSQLDAAMIARVDQVGLFCFVFRMGILDASMLYRHMLDGRGHATNRR